MADAIRVLAMDAVEAAGSGHPGMPMGAADMATVLFTRFLRHDPADPDWPDRDRFVLSAGHGSMLLYALLHLTGYAGIGIGDIRRFRQLGSVTAGHPERGRPAGVEITTGPLGQGFGAAVGMAVAERSMNARHGDALVDHRVWVLASDGDLMEGISHEAAALAGHLGLDRLTVMLDDNRISIDGATGLAASDDVMARFAAYGWDVRACDGHDPEALAAALEGALSSPAPSLVACRTEIGHYAPSKAGTAGSHGAPLGADEVAGARAAMGWTHPPFEIPEDVLAAWREAGRRCEGARREWCDRRDRAADGAELARAAAGGLPDGWERTLDGLRGELLREAPRTATRVSSGRVLDALAATVPDLVGGSADLTGSNNTRAAGMELFSRAAPGGRYIHYGVREHAMAAAMNGMALHGGVVPYGGTFLVFSDYLRPALRLAALMGLRTIHVLTHDSIGLGEDGPTHQPVEHLASLRAMPGVHVFRPADAVEVAECWQLALERADGPSVLALTRQAVPALRTEGGPGEGGANRCRQGAYVIAEAGGERRATLLATGSEVAVAMAAREALEAGGVATAVVSMPCWELFAAQDRAVRDAVLGPGTVRVAVEAASPQGWERWTGGGGFVGMTGFGASAPAGELYGHFGITADAVADAVRSRLPGTGGRRPHGGSQEGRQS